MITQQKQSITYFDKPIPAYHIPSCKDNFPIFPLEEVEIIGILGNSGTLCLVDGKEKRFSGSPKYQEIALRTSTNMEKVNKMAVIRKAMRENAEEWAKTTYESPEFNTCSKLGKDLSSKYRAICATVKYIEDFTAL